MTCSGLFDVSPWSGLDNRIHFPWSVLHTTDLYITESTFSTSEHLDAVQSIHLSKLWGISHILVSPDQTTSPTSNRNFLSKDPLTALILYNIENIKIITQ